VNEVEIARIAAATNQLRPDWPASSLVTLLNRPALVNRHRRDVAVALAWVACDSTSKTPARVLEAGPWWNAIAEADGGAPRVHWLDRCFTCNQSEAACKRVNTGDHEYIANGDAHDKRPPESIARTDVYKAARAELARAKAGVCSHGISPGNCLEKHDEETA